MKKLLTVLCLFSIVALVSACNNGDNGGKGSTIPEVSYSFDGNRAICFNADSSVVTDPTQTCTWNCATYQGSKPFFYTFTFNQANLVNIDRRACKL